MKKNGFTLAEVLITLAIIGVIATMTLPALMTNTAEQQAKTGLKKGINTLTEAAQLSNAVDGFDYASLTSNATGDGQEETQSLFGLLMKRAAIQKYGTADGTSIGLGNQSGNYIMYFRDGSTISFVPDNTLSSVDRMREIWADGMPKGFTGLYDYNGDKKPNMISNCQGETGGLLADGSDEEDGTSLAEKCNTTNRIIKDQFGVRFRGSYVVPNGYAARWAFEN